MKKRAIGRSIFQAKAFLCIALMLNLSLGIGGCGQSAAPLSAPGTLTIPIEAGGQLAESLGGSAFFDATAVEVTPGAKTFRLVFPDNYRSVSGKYVQKGARFAITELRVEQSSTAMTLYLDSASRITAIVHANGERWDRPGHWNSEAAAGAKGLDAFLGANAELVNYAWSMDVQSGNADPNQPPTGGAETEPIPVKDSTALLGPPAVILQMLAALWAPFAIILPMLLGFFGILVGVQGLLALFVPASGLEYDCNQNGVEDAVDIINQDSQDCNNNLIPDECDIADGTSLDCNKNGIPDDCDLAAGIIQDCNQNNIPDECDIAAGAAKDCNNNGVPDSCDLARGVSQDCDQNNTPDECDADADEDGVPDGCDICPGGDDTFDDDDDGVPDGCDICPGGDDAIDSDDDNVPDACDACPGYDDALDADADTVPDGCDICSGYDDKADADGDGNPDGCDPCPADNPDDPDGDFECTSDDNCPDTYNPDQTDSDGDLVGDACDQEACCLPGQSCEMLTQTDCLTQGGVFQGWNTNCDSIDCGMELTVSADVAFVYENLAPAFPACPVTFTATVDDDPYGNTSYSYAWTFLPPADVTSGSTFDIISGSGTNQIECEAPDRPAYSLSGGLWGVRCVVTGNQFANQGEAILDFQVRVAGDANGDGCTNADDSTFITQVQQNPTPDPADVFAVDVNCDGSINAIDLYFVQQVISDFDGHGNGNCAP